MTLNIHQASIRRLQLKAKLEDTEPLGKLGRTSFVLTRLEAPPIERPFPTFAAGVSRDDELCLDRGTRSWQANYPRQQPSQGAAAMFDAKTAVRTNTCAGSVAAANRLGKPRPGIAHDARVQRCGPGFASSIEAEG